MNFAKVMVAMVRDELVLSICSYVCHNMLVLFLLVEIKFFCAKNVAVKPLVSNVQQFKNVRVFWDTV